jgi:pilus assembly protein Flp/PilA
MKSLAWKVARFLQSEEAATAVEYAVMVALIAAVCIGAVTVIGQKSNAAFTRVYSAMPS